MPPSGDPAATSELHCLTFHITYPAAKVLGAEPWRPVVMLENLGADEATIEVTVYDAGGAELSATFAEGRPISVPSGGSATLLLSGAEELPAGQVSYAIPSNQPITGTVVHQTTAGEVQNSDP